MARRIKVVLPFVSRYRDQVAVLKEGQVAILRTLFPQAKVCQTIAIAHQNVLDELFVLILKPNRVTWIFGRERVELDCLIPRVEPPRVEPNHRHAAAVSAIV